MKPPNVQPSAPLSTADRILHAARGVFEREGAAAMSMRRIAQEVGLTPMAIYRHFPNRDALLKRVCDDSFQEIAHHWHARNRGPDAMTRIVALQEIYLDYALAYPHLFDHAFSARREDARRYPDDFRARRSPTLNEVADAVADAQTTGVLKPDDPWEVALTLWAHSHGLIALYRAGRFSCDAKEFRALHKRALQRLLDGLAIGSQHE